MLIVLACLAFPGACATALGDLAVTTGRKLLFQRAESNFGTQYSSDLGKLIDLFALKTVAEQPPASEGGAVEPSAPAEMQVASSPVADSDPIELELTVARHLLVDGRPVPVPVEDGAVLRDGIGRAESGDDLKLRFRVNQPCHVYAVWIDATAWATPIYPLGPSYGYENPVEAERDYELPPGNGWFYLDGYRGVENLYFLASREPISELDLLLAELQGQARALLPDQDAVAMVDEPCEITRGLAGVRPGRATSFTGEQPGHEVPGQKFVSKMGAADLVVTRWFRHE